MSIKKTIRYIFHPIERHNEKSKISESFHDVEIIPMTLDTGTPNKVQEFMTCLRRQISKVNWCTTIKIVGVLCIVGFFFILPTYAQATTADDTLKTTQELLQKFLSLCSRGWIVLAILAGKLMTNDFVYGAFIHMDIYLWKIWNIMKNFANFALAALVMVSIVKGLIGKEALDVKKIITNTLIAGILIQASWFLMGAVIDISTIATASIGAFPMSFLQNDTTLNQNITNVVGEFKQNRTIVDLSSEATGLDSWFKSIEDPYPPSTNVSRKNILPDQNSVSGPFIYLGMGVFRFQNYLNTDNNSGINLTLGFALRFFLLFLFTIALLLLLIANIMRVGLLRIFIIGSPFLILMQVFKLKTGEGLGKILSVGNLVAIAFKPVIFVAGMSLMLIVIVSMQSSITGSGATRENNLNGVSLGKSGNDISTLNVEGISTISVSQKDILGKDVIDQTQNFFSYIIMLLLTTFLMRQFIKLSLTIGGGPIEIEETMKKLTGLAEGMAKTVPILPGGVSSFGAKSIMEKNKKKAFEGMGIDERGNFGRLDQNGKNFTTNETKFDQFINNKLDLQDPWSPNDWSALKKTAEEKPTEFFTESQRLAKGRQGGLSMAANPARMTGLRIALSKDTNIRDINLTLGDSKFSGLLNLNASEATVKEYFDQNVKALYNAMGGSKANTTTKEPRTYEELQNISFWPNKE